MFPTATVEGTANGAAGISHTMEGATDIGEAVDACRWGTSHVGALTAAAPTITAAARTTAADAPFFSRYNCC